MKIRITHIKQRHDDSQNNLLEDEQFEEVALSQFRVAHEIIKRPGAKIISESLAKNYTAADISNFFSIEEIEAKRLFPHGMINNYSDLTKEQKLFLTRQGGDFCVFLLGLVSEIYKSIDEQLGLGLFTLFHSGMMRQPDQMLSVREHQAIEKIKELAENSTEDEIDILLVYGSGHDFENIIKSLNHPAYIFKENIETAVSRNFSQIRLTQLINRLKQVLERDYGDIWTILSGMTNSSSFLRGYIYGSQQEVEDSYQEIKLKLNNSSFKHNYLLGKEAMDEKLDEWYVKLVIYDADILLSQLIAEQINSHWIKSEIIPFELRRAIRQNKFHEYVSQQSLSYELILAIHRDHPLRKNLTPTDYVSMIKCQPEYFKVLLKNPTTLKGIIKNKESLSHLTKINSSILIDILNVEEFRVTFVDSAKKKLVIQTCKDYVEFAKKVMEDVMLWVLNTKLSENDLVDIAKTHPILAADLLEAKNYCYEPIVEDLDNIQTLEKLSYSGSYLLLTQ